MLSLKTDVNVPKVSNKQNNVEKNFFFGISKAPDDKSRIRSRIQIRIHNLMYGSEDSDPFQNVTDREHWLAGIRILTGRQHNA
jgi:hypothetical protein